MNKLENANWLFFDVGGVLTDDTALEDRRDAIIAAAVAGVRRAPTADEMHAARIAASRELGEMTANTINALLRDEEQRAAALTAAKELQKRLLPPGPLSKIRPEAKAVLEALAPRYKLGIMANQPSSTKEKLTAAGILHLFSQTGMSADYDYHKPDPRLYEEIMRETGARPERSVMIDDNYERGLRPAKKLGMRVAWYIEKNSRFLTEETQEDWVIHDLRDLLKIFQK